jgi:pimeloyl-ACP methyl ester carboxylesterase
MAAGGVLMLDLIRPLSAFGPVVAPELPGSIFGQTSTPHPRAGRIETNARFVRTFTSALGLDRVVVHGWSMGAAVALRFAADEPDRVVAAVLACPPLPAPLTRAERLGWQTLGRPALAVGPILARGLVRLVGPADDRGEARLSGRQIGPQHVRRARRGHLADPAGDRGRVARADC